MSARSCKAFAVLNRLDRVLASHLKRKKWKKNGSQWLQSLGPWFDRGAARAFTWQKWSRLVKPWSENRVQHNVLFIIWSLLSIATCRPVKKRKRKRKTCRSSSILYIWLFVYVCTSEFIRNSVLQMGPYLILSPSQIKKTTNLHC